MQERYRKSLTMKVLNMMPTRKEEEPCNKGPKNQDKNNRDMKLTYTMRSEGNIHEM
jgi:hypothetical protein